MQKVMETESNTTKRIGEKLLTIHEHVKKRTTRDYPKQLLNRYNIGKKRGGRSQKKIDRNI